MSIAVLLFVVQCRVVANHRIARAIEGVKPFVNSLFFCGNTASRERVVPMVGSGCNVGFVDVDVVPRIVRSGNAANMHLAKCATARIFYPSSGGKPSMLSSIKSFWLPTWAYARSLPKYALFFRKPSWTTTFLRGFLEAMTVVVACTQFVAATAGAPFLREEEDRKHPVVVLSHGVAGNRNMYSMIATDLAMHGAVVIALEHADGSASLSVTPTSDARAMLPPSVSGTGSSPGDWIVSAPASWPTEPVWYQGLGGDEGTWEKQERRTEEFLLATELARALSTSGGGDVVAVVRGGEADRRVVADMAGRLDSTRMAAVGHSFGAVTAARAAERTGWFRSVVAHDPWWGGLPRDDEMTAAWRHSCPMLVLASHAWHKRAAENPKWGYNRERMEPVLRACEGGALFAAVRDSGHGDFSDLTARAWSIPLVRMALTAIGEEVKEDPLLLLARINAATRWFISRCEEQDAGALEPADVARLSEALGGADEDAELRIGGKAVRATAQAALELKGSKVVLQ